MSSRSLPWIVAAVLASCPSRSSAQDTPLYRDPNPLEGPRIEGPLLPARPAQPALPPPPTSDLGPFQPSNPGVSSPEVLREPLLGIPPIPPPLPAMPMPPMQVGDDVQIKRTTKIRGPNGVLGQFHEWFHETFFGPPKPSVSSSGPKRGFLGVFHSTATDGTAPSRFFHWPAWPAWPLSTAR